MLCLFLPCFVCLVASVNMCCPHGNFNPLALQDEFAFRSFLSVLHNRTAGTQLSIGLLLLCTAHYLLTSLWGFSYLALFIFPFMTPASNSISPFLYMAEYHTQSPAFFSSQGGRDLSFFVHKSKFPADPKGCRCAV